MSDIRKEMNKLMGQLNKAYGKDDADPMVFNVSDRPDLVDLEFYRCNVEAVNEALGGGFAKKTAYLIAGEEGSGKTALALSVAADVLRSTDGVILYILTEPPFPSNTAAKVGLDMDRTYVITPTDNADEAIETVNNLLIDPKTKRPRGLIKGIVFDSFNNAMPKNLLERQEKKGVDSHGMAERARLLTTFSERLQGLNLLREDTVFIGIGQWRASMDANAKAPKIAVPFSIRYNCKVILNMSKRINSEKDSKTELWIPKSQTVKVNVVKNNLSAPPTTISYLWDYATGLDESGHLTALAIEKGIITKPDRSSFGFTYKGENIVITCAKKDLKDHIRELGHTEKLRELTRGMEPEIEEVEDEQTDS